jgi:hypothetical protein
MEACVAKREYKIAAGENRFASDRGELRRIVQR